MSRALEEFKDIYSDFIDRNHSAIVDGYWHLKENRQKFNTKEEDFKHIQNTTEGVLEALQILIETVEGDRDKPGVQPYINQVVKTINIHLDRISKYYPKNKPSGFRTKESKREETKFQQLVFKGEQKIRSKIRDLNIKNTFEDVSMEFHSGKKATIPMRIPIELSFPDLKARIENLEIDWNTVKDKRFYINLNKRDIPEWNYRKHFWEQEEKSLIFYANEWAKIKNGFELDGYFIHPWLYWHLNYFHTPIPEFSEEGDFLGEQVKLPPLRDNEWYFTEILKRAEKRRDSGILIYGSRRFAKSSIIASYLLWKATISPNGNVNVTGGNDKDLGDLTDKMETAMKSMHPAFRLSTNKEDWMGEVEFGLKTKTGTKVKLCDSKVINLAAGSKSSSQKTAGGAPVAFVIEEIGKFSWRDAFDTAIPSFETLNGWKTIPLLIGTGGEESLSKDAEKVLSDPEANDLMEMDWDLLEWQVPKEGITWERRKFGCFIPAQMGYKTGFKRIKREFSNFLNIESEELSKISILQTDWINNTEICKTRRDKLKKDLKKYQKEVVFYPLDPNECFMSAKDNPFPSQNLKKHKDRLQSEFGDDGSGIKIELIRDKENKSKINYFISNKSLATFPHQGGFVDAPFLLFSDFPEERPERYRYVAGLDCYKHEESDGDSVGSFVIFDRLTRKIVLSLATRPDPQSNFHMQIHMALDAYNAILFPENEDMSIKKYFDRLHMSDYYLGEGFDVTSQFHLSNTGRRKYGWQPHKTTTPFVRGLVLDYVKRQTDILDEDDNVVSTEMGLERIEDIQLLEEMIKYKEDGNFDRIVGFGSALLYDHYLTAKYIVPSSKPQIKKGEQEKSKPIKNKYFRKGRNLWKN